MKQISNKEYEAYQQYQTDKLYGRILTPDGLRIVCASLDNDPEKIGKHMLEMLVKFRNEGLFDIVVEDETDDGPENGRSLTPYVTDPICLPDPSRWRSMMTVWRSLPPAG